MSRRARGQAADVTVSDGVLVTKLHVPRPPPGLVRRSRLIELLEDGMAGDLTVVCAPAGFGKTALVTDWIRQRERETAWVSLDAGDNDAVRFWRHLLAALDRFRSGIAERVGPLLDAPGPVTFDGVVTSVVNELVAEVHGGEVRGGSVVSLVLDDYHVIDARPVHDSVQLLLDHAPRGVHITLTSRADPPLALARRRARRELTEVRAAELRFTSDEAAVLLRQATGPALDDDDVGTLNARTEGWVAGLQLAGLSLRGQADVKGFVATFSGSHRYVLDYLAEEVLESQPAPVRDFLLETSVLDRLSGPLCDAVTGRADGQEMLEAIEQANLFLVPLDEERRWWRYHHLFADLLRERLGRAEPERVRRLHAGAAGWLAANDLHGDAIGHSVAAGDVDQAGRLIEDRFDELFRSGEQATIQRWLASLPNDVVRSRPRLCVAASYVALFTNDLDLVDDSLAAAGEAAPVGDDRFAPSVGLAASLIGNVPVAAALVGSMSARARGDVDATRSLAETALALVHPEERTLHDASRQQLAIARWLSGRLDEAERLLTTTIAGWRSGELVMITWAANALGPLQRARGRLSAAADTYERLLARSTARGEPGRLAAEGLAHVGLAEIAYERGQLDRAHEHVTEGIVRGRRLGYGRLLSTGLARMAWICHANGDHDAARAAVEEAYQVIPTHGPTDLTPAPVLRAKLLLVLGDIDEVARWATDQGLDPDDAPDHLREGEYLVLARLLVARDQPGAALGLLDRLHTAAAAQQRSTIEIQTLRAIALAAQGDDAAASAAFSEALALGHPEGHLRVFVDEGEPVAALVGRLVAAGAARDGGAVPLGYLHRIASELDPIRDDRASPGGAANATLIVPLTQRELDVLRMLAEGRSNQAIADELHMALNTVKHHVSHILDKVGAGNRTEAVARAREVGLLP